MSYLHWMSASIHTCGIFIPSLLCHTYIFLHFVCIILCEIFFASMSATWGFLVKGLFTTGFASCRLHFVQECPTLFSRFGLARIVEQYFLPIITNGWMDGWIKYHQPPDVPIPAVMVSSISVLCLLK